MKAPERTDSEDLCLLIGDDAFQLMFFCSNAILPSQGLELFAIFCEGHSCFSLEEIQRAAQQIVSLAGELTGLYTGFH